MKKLFFILIIFQFSIKLLSQNTAWTPVTLPLTKDTISLEDMSGSTTATFNAASFNATALIDFPSGFTFQFGLTTFSKFSISAYGYIKLGALPSAINPTSQDSIISALYAFPSTYPVCTYKLIGAAPYRRLIIEWNGTLSSSGPARFQLWLSEKTGTIQFIYNTIKSYSLGNGYAIFCKSKIFGANSIVSVKTRNLNQNPIADYIAIESNNYDSIYAKSRFTFQPDTTKPIKPGNLRFANVLPGCFAVEFIDSSMNESIFRLEKLDTGIYYYLLKNVFSTTALTQGTVYNHNETRMQPDSLYKYRVFASNGFINSDTVYKEIRTPMPLIFGTKKIPGDYSSINDLLFDAECKHIGPELIIELQNNYSYSLEALPVRFKRNLQTKVLKNVTIRPSIGSSLILSSAATAPLFTIDSVKYIGFDGRPGGIGNSIGMTIRQLDSLRPAISYVHYADSGKVQFCNIEGKSFNANYGLVYIGYKDAQWNSFPPGVNGTVIRNCKIGSASGGSDQLLVIDNNGRGDSILIENNEFYRFKNSAVFYNFGGTGSRFTKNRFYQPEQIGGNTTAIKVIDNRGFCLIDSNKIGGSSATWGIGKWSSFGFLNTVSMIDYTGNFQSYVIIKGNEFGNISLTGGTLQMIKVSNSRTDIENNKIGTADSTNSVVSQSHNYAIALGGNGTKTVRNNFFSGMQADYPTQSGNQDLVMITSFFMDSLIIRGNDFGGSDNRFSNYTGGQARCISLGGIRNAIIINNEIRGITSKNMHVFGIEQEWAGTSPTEKNMIADSNRIHHLQGKLTVYGIYSRIYSGKLNRFDNNKIYALRGIGPSVSPGTSQPAFTGGIIVEHSFPPSPSSIIDTGSVEIKNNYIHSLDYYTPSGVYTYQMTGIGVVGRKIKVNNNMLQLGIKPDGFPSDSVELEIKGVFIVPPNVAPTIISKAEIEHNSIYIGGVGIQSAGMDFPISSNTNGNKNIFLSNNIIHIDRSRPSSLSNQRYYMHVNGSGNSIVSNKNIWFSQNDPTINNSLADWQSRCQCDQNTVIADPKFINPTGDSLSQNLHLQTISPADSSGTPSVGNIDKDIDDQVRNNYSPIDIGADAITPCAGNPANIQINLTPGKDLVEICTGTTFSLTATISGGSITQLQWQKNLNDIAGATGTTYTVTEPGAYRVVGKLLCGKIASRTMVVITGPSNPIVKLSSLTPVPYCDSSNITLKAEYISNAVNPPQVKWFKNNILQNGLNNTTETFNGIKQNDRYRVEITNDLTCGQFTGKDSITIGMTQISYRPKIQVLKYDTLRCGTTTDTIRYRITNVPFYFPTGILFVTPAPGATYRNIGDSIIILENLPAQHLQIRLYNMPLPALQCYYPDTSQILSINYLSTVAPGAAISGNSIVSSSVLNNQWYTTPDNLIPGATNQTYTPSASGSYFVRIKSGNCISSSSNIVDFIITALPQINPSSEELQLYPNPSDGFIWLKSKILSESIMSELSDAEGKIILTRRQLIQRNVPLQINISTIPSGIFFLKVYTRNKIYLFKIVKL